jgi:hypothetical protein
MANLYDPTFWIPTVISLVAVVLAYMDIRRRQTQDRIASQATLSFIATLKRELQLVRNQLAQGFVSNELLAQQRLAQKREQDAWNRLVDIAKGIGWFMDRMDFEDEYQ